MYELLLHYTHLTASFPGQPGQASTRKVKPVSIGFEWGKRWWGFGIQWHQLDHMQTICTSLQTDNHTNTSSLNFYRPNALPDAKPTLSNYWRQVPRIKSEEIKTVKRLSCGMSRSASVTLLRWSQMTQPFLCTSAGWCTCTRPQRSCPRTSAWLTSCGSSQYASVAAADDQRSFCRQ